ncbi:MAG: hypothetical protein NZV14_15680 [Bryobacteraceae bacterium]|nr:hypothetical protein [Bryobacteraceae bacterium]MDW8379601.1 hypothetical protein [Bryobacterales bacterium]
MFQTLCWGAVELQIQYSAIQKVLAQQMFANQGRFYVKGNEKTKCSYAFLENPMVGGAAQDTGPGKIRIQARFQGKNGANFFGLCLGPGDSFDLLILATPYFDKGLIRLKEVEVSSPGKESFYARKVREAIEKQLPARFEYRVADEAKRLLERERPAEPYTQHLREFKVSSIRVSADAITLNLDFTLVVK